MYLNAFYLRFLFYFQFVAKKAESEEDEEEEEEEEEDAVDNKVAADASIEEKA